VPNRHIDPSANHPQDEPLIGHLFTIARQLAHEDRRKRYRLIAIPAQTAARPFSFTFALLRSDEIPDGMIAAC
jgi:hypothetical protein